MPKKLAKAIEDDVEGHGRKPLPRVDGSDDTEGHGRKPLPRATGSQDDTEGHRRGRIPNATGSEDDTEGHSFIPDPLSSRILAQAREREIQGRMRDNSKVKESRNPFRRSKG